MRTMVRIAFVFLLLLWSVCGFAETRRRAVRRNSPAGPAAEATHYRGGAARTGVYGTAGPRSAPNQLWRVQAAAPSFSAIVYAGGTLYLEDGTGRVVALNGETGATRWRTPFLSSIISAPTVTADAVYIGVDGRAVLALSVSDGHQLARFDVDSEVFASPLISDDTLYVATESGALYAFDLVTGQQKWRFSGPGPAHGHPAAWNGNVYFGSGAALLAVDRDGHERWRLVGASPFFSPSLGVSDLKVVGSSGNTVYSVDALTGETKWTYTGANADTGFSAPVLWSGLAIFGTVAPYGLIALNADTGTVVWQTPLPAFIEPIFSGGILYGGSGEFGSSANPNATQKVYAFDVFTGQQLWATDVVGQVVTGAAIGDERVFVFTQARYVFAFE